MESADLPRLNLPDASPSDIAMTTPEDPKDAAPPPELFQFPRKAVIGAEDTPPNPPFQFPRKALTGAGTPPPNPPFQFPRKAITDAGDTPPPPSQPKFAGPGKPVIRHSPNSSVDTVETLVDVFFEDVTDYVSRKGTLEPVPKIRGHPLWARIRWGFFTTYRRLFSLVFMGNMIALIIVLYSHRTLPAVANAVAANLAVTGLIRVPYVVNTFYFFICLVPRSFPLWFRRAAAEMPHFGGVHSGCGVAAVFWYIALCGMVTRDYAISAPPALQHDQVLLVLMYLILCLTLFIIIAAHPTLRFKFHDYFELTHRFSAWLLIPLFWAFLVVFAHKQAQAEDVTLGWELVRFPAFWFAVILTVAFFIPWLTLRRVPVDPEYLSGHAVRLHFDYATTGFAQGVSVSKHPLKDWHSFAGVPNIDGTRGFSLIVSKAGDWTGSAIKEQPRHLWKRGIPTSGFGRNCLIFNRILIITTGSGMGPCLSLLSAANRPPIRILWQTRSPLKTYGQRVLDMVAVVDKGAVIIDSDRHGRQDMLPIAWDMVKDFNAEAVFVISRPSIVQKFVFEFEARGIPAYGPVFDS